MVFSDEFKIAYGLLTRISSPSPEERKPIYRNCSKGIDWRANTICNRPRSARDSLADLAKLRAIQASLRREVRAAANASVERLMKLEISGSAVIPPENRAC